MIAHGIVPMVDGAIFADTQSEPKHVYTWLGWLESQVPFPIYRVTAGNLRADILESVATGKRAANPPFFSGGGGLLMRQCTAEYKISPIIAKIRELADVKPRSRPTGVLVEQLIGISQDEYMRMKPSHLKWIKNIWPLVDLNLTRWHCLEWMTSHGYPTPPKSACTFCPYRDNAMWQDMKLNDPESFADAVAMDEAIRPGLAKTSEGMYLHRSLKPISEIDFRGAEERGQGRLFNDECEGMCGV